MTFPEKVNAINAFEKKEGYPKDSILKTMLFETGGTLSTTIQNKYSNAIGLIQWLPSTLSLMGLSVAVVKGMSFYNQLELVKDYLKPYRTKLLATNDPIDFYLAILYPALIGKPDSAIMAANDSKTYLQNKGLDIDKDGDIQKSDIRYAFNNAVNKLAIKTGVNLFNPLSSLIVLIIFSTIIFLIIKK